MKRSGGLLISLCAATIFFGASLLLASNSATAARTVPTLVERDRLIWSDEFKGAPGSAPNNAVWNFYDGPVYNNELEKYVSDPANCHLVRDSQATDGSVLAITATSPAAGQYRSARLNTIGKYSTPYSYIEVRCKLAAGQGMWPSFWMMGTKDAWPKGGEIDVMENIGKEPSTNHASIHGQVTPSQKPDDYRTYNVTAQYAVPFPGKLTDSYHTYGLLWKPKRLTLFVDGHRYASFTPASLPQGSVWPFDSQPCYFILNLAVGGDDPGSPDATTRFPQTFSIDYVRVYSG